MLRCGGDGVEQRDEVRDVVAVVSFRDKQGLSCSSR